MVKDLRKKYLTFNENTLIKTIFRPYMETAPRYVVPVFGLEGSKRNHYKCYVCPTADRERYDVGNAPNIPRFGAYITYDGAVVDFVFGIGGNRVLLGNSLSHGHGTERITENTLAERFAQCMIMYVIVAPPDWGCRSV